MEVKPAMECYGLPMDLKLNSLASGKPLKYTVGPEQIKDSTAAAMSQIVDCMVELSGIEPLASSLRTRRSPS